jgi:aminopeptidase C
MFRCAFSHHFPISVIPIRRMSGSPITVDLIKKFQASYESDPKNLLATNAICNNSVTDVVLKRDVSTANKHQVFSSKMKYKEAKITDQKSTVNARF